MQDDKIRDLLKHLLIDEPFWGNILIQGEIVEDKGVPIAAMSAQGDQLYFHINPDTFWGPRFTQAQKIAILKHEVMHAALLHPLRLRNSNIPPEAWNICCDLEVNSYIPELNYHDPEKDPKKKIQFLFPDQFQLPEKKTAEWYHKNMPRGKGKGGKKMIWDYAKGDGNGDGNGKSQKQGQGNGKGKKQPQNQGQGKGKGNGNQPSAAQQHAARQSQQQHKHWKTFKPFHKQIMKKVIKRASRMAGKTPGEFESLLNNLYKGKLNWRWIFQRAATRGTMKARKEKFTWSRPNRRDDRLKGRKRLRMPDIICAVDTSGSMSDKDLQECFSEINKLTLIARSLWLLQFDTKITFIKKVKRLNPKAIKAVGRGGTNFCACFDYVEKEMIQKRHMKNPLLIVLTDGYDEEGDPRPALKKNLIWIILEDREVNKKWGKVIPLPCDKDM